MRCLGGGTEGKVQGAGGVLRVRCMGVLRVRCMGVCVLHSVHDVAVD